MDIHVHVISFTEFVAYSQFANSFSVNGMKGTCNHSSNPIYFVTKLQNSYTTKAVSKSTNVRYSCLVIAKILTWCLIRKMATMVFIHVQHKSASHLSKFSFLQPKIDGNDFHIFMVSNLLGTILSKSKNSETCLTPELVW